MLQRRSTCFAAAGLGTTLLMSKATRDALQRPLELRALRPQPVKGVDQSVEIFPLAS